MVQTSPVTIPSLFLRLIDPKKDRFRPLENRELRSELGVGEANWLLVYSESMKPIRQLDILIKAFVIAQRELENLHLLFVGEGTAVIGLEELSTSLGLSDRIHFYGHVPYDQMTSFLNAADVGLGYVPITPWFNQAPVLKTLKAMACGLLTIATDTVGNRMYIVDGQNGTLVDDMPEKISAAIVQLNLDQELQQRLTSSRESIQKYEWKNIVQKTLLPFYEELVDR